MRIIEYHTRNHAFVPPMTLRVDANSLSIDQKGRARESVPINHIQKIELTYFPTRAELNRYRCRLYVHNRKRIEFFNRTYKGIMDFEDTSEAYKAFIMSLHEIIAQQNPACVFFAGVSHVSYWINVGCLGFVLFVLILALVFFITLGILWLTFIKVLILLYYLPYAVKWIRRNVPKKYSPDRIPTEVLPA